MLDKDQKPELPVHLVIGTNEYTQIKTESTPRIGRPGEPIAEKTKFGWTIMSPGREVNVNEMFLTQTCSADYESLCRLDVLGLQDSPTGDQGEIHKEFLETTATESRRLVRDWPSMERKSSTSFQQQIWQLETTRKPNEKA
jgi:hypothetical protein